MMFKLSKNNEIKIQCYFLHDYSCPESSEFQSVRFQADSLGDYEIFVF